MKPVRFPVAVKGNYIGGEFQKESKANGQWTGKSPAALTDITGEFSYSYDSVDRAVEAATKAQKAWKQTSFAERASLLNKYGEILKRREEELTEVIARETGKPLWESKTEVGAMLNKISISLNEGMKPIEAHSEEGILPNTRGSYSYSPLGVVAVIGPFNFPGHLPNGHIVPALAAGNTIVFKSSEKTPLIAQLMAECFHEAGFPKGVFNAIVGEKEVGRRLCVHEGIHGVFFTGSYEVGTRIKQDTLLQHWKLLALEMGGKNAAIVWEDADFPNALLECLIGAFISCGQRCSATSRVLVHRSILEKFVTSLHERAKKFDIGHPFDNPFMGPLIDQSSVDRYQKFQGIATREGCELIMRGKSFKSEDEGYYVTPSIALFKEIDLKFAEKSVYLQTELFAPNVAIVPVDSVEEAIQLANATQYGLVASVFTQNEKLFHEIAQDLEVGLVNWNRATVGASSKLPFGGLKKSGNHFPTALTASRYCTYPQSFLEVKQPKMNAAPYQGLHWE